MEISVSSLTQQKEAVGEFLQYLIDQNFWHKWATDVKARTPVDIASYEDDNCANHGCRQEAPEFTDSLNRWIISSRALPNTAISKTLLR